jgi:hypothetical protein
MGWSDETEEGFPPQRHKEPLALRQDILDELADHLSEAADRERDSGVQNDQEIRRNVLDKFGNPAAIAHALWWDAMKGTIMKDWIQIAINVLLCLGVMAFMTVFYNQMQTSNTALLGAISGLNTPLAEQQDPKVEFVLHRGSEDGPVAEGVTVNIQGAFFNAEKSYLRSRSDENGTSQFGPIAAGLHAVYILDPVSGLNSRQSFTVYKGDGTKTIHIAIPPDTPTMLDTSNPFAGNTTIDPMRFTAVLAVFWDHKGETWTEDDPMNRGRVERTSNAIITNEGLFLRDEERHARGVKAGEAVTEVYGNRILLSFSSLLYSKTDENENDEWIRTAGLENNAQYFEIFEFTPGVSTVLTLNLSDSLLDAYNYNRRLGLNQDHGLPDSFGWFESWITGRYENYTIDSASLVERSGVIMVGDTLFQLSEASNKVGYRTQTLLNSDFQWMSQRYSFKNAPTEIPPGYKLLLGFNRGTTGKIHSLDPLLHAYADTFPASHELTEQFLDLDNPAPLGDPVWSMTSTEVSELVESVALIDFTDAYTAALEIDGANGIFFKWDKASKNELRFEVPEFASDDGQPVWILLKPYPEID